MNIDEMAAGRELDALVAEKVMGFEKQHLWSNGGSETFWCPQHDDGQRLCSQCGETQCCSDIGDCAKEFSTDIAAAWEVVEKFSDTHRFTFVRWFGKDGTRYAASFWVLMDSDVVPKDYFPADTAPLAICRAALKAVL